MIAFSGAWRLGNNLPPLERVSAEIERPPKVEALSFDTTGLSEWDSGLLILLIKIIDRCARIGIRIDRTGLPKGVERLLELSSISSGKREVQENPVRHGFLAGIGGHAIAFAVSFVSLLNFLGEAAASFGRLFVGKARFRGSDLWLVVQECGPSALPIVSLISILVGLILAFVGSVQLKMFGAQIYIADLVGIAMVRAMGAIMAGIIMAGRTGASFAARIGTMQVNEEIDALKTTGISPMDFLVLPRIIALALMMPLLTLYADLMGILGGLVVAVSGFDMTAQEYLHETKASLTLTNVGIGVFSGLVFGVLVATAGCLRGMECGRSASAVGDATTSAVVSGIVGIIVATVVITMMCNVFGF